MERTKQIVLNTACVKVFFEKKEDLETHLNTCEIYRCSKCKKKEKTIKDIENHVINEHDSEKYIMID